MGATDQADGCHKLVTLYSWRGLTVAALDGVESEYVLADAGHAAGELGVRPRMIDEFAESPL